MTRNAIVAPSWGPLGVLLGHSWRPLGALLGGLGALVLVLMAKEGGVPQFLSPPIGGSNVPSWGFAGSCRVFAGSLQGLCRGGTLQRPCKDPAKLESWRPLGAVLAPMVQKEGGY